MPWKVAPPNQVWSRKVAFWNPASSRNVTPSNQAMPRKVAWRNDIRGRLSASLVYGTKEIAPGNTTPERSAVSPPLAASSMRAKTSSLKPAISSPVQSAFVLVTSPASSGKWKRHHIRPSNSTSSPSGTANWHARGASERRSRREAHVIVAGRTPEPQRPRAGSRPRPAAASHPKLRPPPSTPPSRARSCRSARSVKYRSQVRRPCSSGSPLKATKFEAPAQLLR